MAKLPLLVTEVAKVDGRERPVVDNYARRLRENGLICGGGGKRGAGAPDMDHRSAANLLTALAVSETAKDAHVEVARMRSLKKQGGPTTTDGLFRRIEDASDFGEALEKLLGGVPELVAIAHHYIENAYTQDDHEQRQRLLHAALMGLGPVNVTVEMTRYFARIFTARELGEVDWEARYIVDARLFMEGFYSYNDADRKVVSSFGLPTLLAIARCLNTDEDDPEPSEGGADAAV